MAQCKNFPVGNVQVKTVEMHTAGEPLRIVVSGYPKFEGDTILAKRQFALREADHLRRLLMHEPRGHHGMYGAILVEPGPSEAGADLAVLFCHIQGLSPMCGHGTIALGRFAVDRGYVGRPRAPETRVCIQCPCGPVTAFVEYDEARQRSGAVRFNSVPSFAFALDAELNVNGYGKVTIDIGYGGAFYVFLVAQSVGLDVRTSPISEIIAVSTVVKKAAIEQFAVKHPDSQVADLEFIYGVIVTDGEDAYSDRQQAHVCIFADAEVDRSPCGSGVTARVALQYARGQLALQESRVFESGVNGTTFTAKPVQATKCGDRDAVIVEVRGQAYYTGEATYTLEEDDQVGRGFLPR